MSGPCERFVPHMTGTHLAHPPSTSQVIRPNRQRHAQNWRPVKKVRAGVRVLLRHDAARFAMLPTRRTTLGVTGHCLLVGHLDGHDGLDVSGALTRVTG